MLDNVQWGGQRLSERIVGDSLQFRIESARFQVGGLVGKIGQEIKRSPLDAIQQILLLEMDMGGPKPKGPSIHLVS